MQCPACQHENEPAAHFCEGCGIRLARSCPSCGKAVGPQARFCPGCGATLAAPGAEGTTTRPLSGADAVATAGERRQLTVVFCDLVGSTALSQQFDAEDWRDVIAQYQQAASGAVARFGGHVAKNLGDGLLIYFGWPTAREDDPERAVRAGLAIVEAVRSTSDLSVRVGLHTGPVVIADGGEVFGETANVAARVQSAAEPDTVVISAATQRLVAGMFVVDDRGPQSLKGVRDPVTLYRVVRPSGVRSRLDVAAGRLTRFVGREVELATLGDRWERAADGEGQTVLIVGEAGVGKSRLSYELRERLAAVPHTWLECGCTPYTESTPFHPVIGLVSQGLTLTAEDTEAEKLGKIRLALESAGLASADAVALVADFLGLPPPTPLGMGPDVQRRQTIELLAAWNLALSETQPLVLLVEDLHWCDPSSLELLGRVMAQSATARVLLLATARPEFTPPWPARSNVITLQLARLTRRQARAMATALGAGALPEEMLETLVARADGMPLYVEELTKTVIEPGAARGGEAIPPTLADSLMARLDRLSTAKEVAQKAAVLGREFSYALLAAVAGVEEAGLHQGLAHLVDAEILYVRGEPPHAVYTFKHTLVQEAAYGALLRRTRQRLHERVARALEQRFTDVAVRAPEAVARHYEAAAMPEEAIDQYQRAAGQALVRSAHEEAIRHLRRALELVEACRAGRDRDQRELMLRLALGNALAGGVSLASPETHAAYERARELGEAIGDDWQLAPALWGLSVYYTAAGMLDRGLDLARQLHAISERTSAEVHQLSAHEELAVPLYYRGDFATSLRHCERGIEIYDLHYDRARNESMAWVYPTEPGVPVRIYAGLNAWQLGYPDRAGAWLDQAEALARGYRHPYSIAFALVFCGLLHWMTGDVERQAAAADEAIATCERHRLLMWLAAAKMVGAAALAARGQCDLAMQQREEALELAARAGGQAGLPIFMALQADVLRAAGQGDMALSAVTLGLSLAEQGEQHCWTPELLRQRGELLVPAAAEALRNAVVQEEAERWFRSALRVAEEHGARMQQLRAVMSLARLRRDQGKRAEARDLLAPVYGWFTEGFDTRDLIEAKALLDELR